MKMTAYLESVLLPSSVLPIAQAQLACMQINAIALIIQNANLTSASKTIVSLHACLLRLMANMMMAATVLFSVNVVLNIVIQHLTAVNLPVMLLEIHLMLMHAIVQEMMNACLAIVLIICAILPVLSHKPGDNILMVVIVQAMMNVLLEIAT